MSDSTQVDETTQNTPDGESQDTNDSSTVTDAEAKIAELNALIEKQNEIVANARKAEKYAKTKASNDQKSLQAMYQEQKERADALESKLKAQASDSVLRQVLAESGAKAVDTALKLVDRQAIKFSETGDVDTESIKALVSKMKETDSILFDATPTTTEPVSKPITPPTVRATESDRVVGFNAEIASAKTHAELQAVLKKYGK